MISISAVSPGAASSGYYQAEGYYEPDSEEARDASRWFGKAAEAAGLTGPVDYSRFECILDGQAPNGQLLGRMRDGVREHRLGEDITFSAPKSVSFAALVMGDARVIAAHDRAVLAAMTYVESHLVMTRQRSGAGIETLKAGRIMAGLFRHDTSRALDPQLHTHAVIANMVRLPGEDRYRSLLNDMIYTSQKSLDAIYSNALARELEATGYVTERSGPLGLLSIKGIPAALMEQFSKRRTEILTALEERGMAKNPRTAELAALATRAAKQGALDRGDLRAAWEKEAADAGWSQEKTRAFLAETRRRAVRLGGVTRDDPVPRHRVESRFATTGPQVAAAVDFAVAHISERASIYTRDDLFATALGRAPNSGPEALGTEIARRLARGALLEVVHDGKTFLTDRDSLTREREMLAELRKAARAPALSLRPSRGPAGRIAHSGEGLLMQNLERSTLTQGQRQAILTGLTGTGRVVGVQGHAGTGKTFMLAKLAEHAARNGYTLEGLAPSNEAVRQLASVIPEAGTLQARLARQDHRPDPNGGKTRILVVDEASMISTADMKALLAYANGQRFARVVLVGDIRQLDAVGAGAAFAQLQRAGMPTALMDDIQRQRTPEALATVRHAIAGEVRAAFETIGAIARAQDLSRAAAEAWLARPPQDRAATGIIALTNAARREINAHVRDGLKDEGSLARTDVTLQGLDPLNFTRAEKGDAVSYDIGDVVVPIRAIRAHGLDANTRYRVVGRDIAANSITLRPASGGGTPATLTLSQTDRISGSLSVNREETRAFAPGDLVRFTITDPDHGVTNAMRAHIEGIGPDSIALGTGDGARLDLPRSSIAAAGMDHAYALTAHGFQGQSVDRAILAISAGERLATRKAFYVGVSRVRDGATLITDDPEKLATRLERDTGERPAALDALAEAERTRTHATSDPPREREPGKHPDERAGLAGLTRDELDARHDALRRDAAERTADLTRRAEEILGQRQRQIEGPIR